MRQPLEEEVERKINNLLQQSVVPVAVALTQKSNRRHAQIVIEDPVLRRASV